MKRDVVGLNLVDAKANPALRRVRAQLKAADALVTLERDESEPERVQRLRRKGEALLRDSRYEEAEEVLLDAIEAGLEDDYFCWHAAVNLVNCHRFLGRLADAEATAAQLATMYTEQGQHPIHYLLATQRGAIAADRWDSGGEPADAEAALAWARRAYTWQTTWRHEADGLRAYNLVVALLRCSRRDEALEICNRHAHDDAFQTWCKQGDQADAIAALLNP